MSIRNRVKTRIENALNIRSRNKVEVMESNVREVADALSEALNDPLEHFRSRIDEIVNFRLLEFAVLRLKSRGEDELRVKFLFDWEDFSLRIEQEGVNIDVPEDANGKISLESVHLQSEALKKAISALKREKKIDSFMWVYEWDKRALEFRGHDFIEQKMGTVRMTAGQKEDFNSYETKTQTPSSVKENPSLSILLQSVRRRA